MDVLTFCFILLSFRSGIDGQGQLALPTKGAAMKAVTHFSTSLPTSRAGPEVPEAYASR